MTDLSDYPATTIREQCPPGSLSTSLNGKDYRYSAIRHKDIIAGGELILKMGKKPGEWGKQLLSNEENKK